MPFSGASCNAYRAWLACREHLGGRISHAQVVQELHRLQSEAAELACLLPSMHVLDANRHSAHVQGCCLNLLRSLRRVALVPHTFAA